MKHDVIPRRGKKGKENKCRMRSTEWEIKIWWEKNKATKAQKKRRTAVSLKAEWKKLDNHLSIIYSFLHSTNIYVRSLSSNGQWDCKMNYINIVSSQGVSV